MENPIDLFDSWTLKTQICFSFYDQQKSKVTKFWISFFQHGNVYEIEIQYSRV